MSSEKKKFSNKLNAQKSTGPKTTEGKLVVSKNSLQHGLLANETLLAWENSFEFGSFANQMKDSLQPVGEIESLLVDRIIANAWKLKRAERIEAGIISQQRYSLNAEIERDKVNALSGNSKSPIYETIVKQNIQKSLFENPDLIDLGIVFRENADTINKIQKYGNSLEKSFFKALHELQRIQAMRQGENVSLPIAVDINGEKN